MPKPFFIALQGPEGYGTSRLESLGRMKAIPITSPADVDWLQMRRALWPDASPSEHLEEMSSLVAEPHKFAQFIEKDEHGKGMGFVEASIRTDYVNGTVSSPVAFLEGLYVKARARRRGVARSLVSAVAQWARSKGCKELASDAAIRNRTSHAVHKSLGFAETERVVYFNRRLD